MTAHQASRTLVKSHPELWSECSDAASLARHLGQFGEIRITRLEPETAVAWEGELASGTVRLEPSGWGTRVILTARQVPEEALEAAERQEAELLPQSPPEPEPLPPAAGAIPERPPRVGLLARLRKLLAGEPAAVLEPSERVLPADAEVEAEPVDVDVGVQAEPEVEASAPAELRPQPERDPPAATCGPAPDRCDSPAGVDTSAALRAALDSLGQAHHRPFSRA
jgi:hypothetical protein